MVILRNRTMLRLGSSLACAIVALIATALLSAPVNADDSAIDPNFFCPAELLPNDLCGSGCSTGFVRAVEVEGVRHVVWTAQTNSISFFVAVSTKEGVWTVEAVPIPEATAPVSISAVAIDGDLLALGRTGSVHLFRLMDHAWVHETTLSSTVLWYGRSVALSRDDDGTERLAVGAALLTTGGSSPPGKVFLYRRDPAAERGASTWLEEVVLTPPRAALEPKNFGGAVAIHGSTLLVSAPNLTLGFPNGLTGIFVFNRVGDDWVYEGEVIAPAWLHYSFGERLALRGDTFATTNGRLSGFSNDDPTRVVTFARSGGTWSFAAVLQSEAPGTLFLGADMAVADSASGLLLAVTVARQTSTPVPTSAWLFRLQNGVPVESIRLRHPAAVAGNLSAKSVALIAGDHPMAVISGLTTPALALRVVRAVDDDCDGDGIGDSCALSDAPELDCDDSGVPDLCEIADGLLVDRDGNGIPDICQVSADLNGDGLVDGADLGLLLANWGSPGVGDLTENGSVTAVDLGLLLAAWSE